MINLSRHLRHLTIASLLSLICICSLNAEIFVYRGSSTSIIPDKSCKNSPKSSDFIFVFDGGLATATTGWFYGDETSAAEFHRTSPTTFEVVYGYTGKNKIKPSKMVLQPAVGGFRAVISDTIPDEQNLREKVCLYERMEINLIPIKITTVDYKERAIKIYESEILVEEALDLITVQYEYEAGIAKGKKALAIVENLYGKNTKEALNVSAVIVTAFLEMERYDEALNEIAPYKQSQQDNDTLKAIEKQILIFKQEQDELFQYDLNNRSKVQLEPLG